MGWLRQNRSFISWATEIEFTQVGLGGGLTFIFYVPGSGGFKQKSDMMKTSISKSPWVDVPNSRRMR